MEENISFKCSPLADKILSDIKNLLPDWKTKVVAIREPIDSSSFQIKICIPAKTVEEIKIWLYEYQYKTNSTYSIKSTEQSTGRYVNFKQRLYCHYNKTWARTRTKSDKNRRKNTNCPASINITLRAVKKAYRGKDPSKAPDPEMPCEIMLKPLHNHETNSVELSSFFLAHNVERIDTSSTVSSTANDADLIKEESEETTYLQNQNVINEIEIIDISCDNYADLIKEESEETIFVQNQRVINEIEIIDTSSPVSSSANDVDLIEEESEETMFLHNQKVINKIEIIDTSNPVSSSVNNADLIEEESEEIILQQNQEIINEIAKTFTSFSQKAPYVMRTALARMKDNLNKVKTVSAFISSCEMFALDVQRIRHRAKIPVQHRAVDRRKIVLAGKSCKRKKV